MLRMNNPLAYESVKKSLAALHDCGIRMFPESTVEDVLVVLSFDDDHLTNYLPSYKDILSAISFETNYLFHVHLTHGDDETDLPLSDSVWYLDEECIYGEGDYEKIIEAMRTLAKDNLPIENISEKFDLENKGVVQLKFRLQNMEYYWEMKLRHDWLDREILTKTAQLLNDQNQLLRYAICRDSDLSGFVVCLTLEQIERLNQTTGLEFIIY